MEHNMRVTCRRWIVAMAILGLGILGATGLPSAAAQTGPGTLCVVQVAADGAVLSVFVDQLTNFNVAILVPEDKQVNVPVTCDILETLGLGVTNQKNSNVNVVAQVFSNTGSLICSKGPFQLAVNGGRGFIFSDCQ